jgi:chromosomal replication initiation ATPase DnaA
MLERDIKKLFRYCAEEFGMSYDVINEESRTQEAIMVKQLAIAILKEHYNLKYQTIADKLGHDRKTIKRNYNKHQEEINRNRNIQQLKARVIHKLESEMPQ